MVGILPKVITPINASKRAELDIRPGDTVKVSQKIHEKGKVRLQMFEGLVLARKRGTEAGATFTVRKVIDGIGVEKIFPLYSPMIDKIDVVRRAKVRRAKLYYIREKAAKEIRKQMKNTRTMYATTGSDIGDKAETEAAFEAGKIKETEKMVAEEKSDASLEETTS